MSTASDRDTRPAASRLGDGREEHVDDLAGFGHQLVRYVGALPRAEESGKHLLDGEAARSLGEEVGGAPAEGLRSRVPEPLEPAVAHAEQAALGVDRVQHHRCAGVQCAALLLAARQSIVGPLAFTDVPEREQQPAVGERDVPDLLVVHARRRAPRQLGRHGPPRGPRERERLTGLARGLAVEQLPRMLAYD